jgi:hypothetical protein
MLLLTVLVIDVQKCVGYGYYSGRWALFVLQKSSACISIRPLYSSEVSEASQSSSVEVQSNSLESQKITKQILVEAIISGKLMKLTWTSYPLPVERGQTMTQKKARAMKVKRETTAGRTTRRTTKMKMIVKVIMITVGRIEERRGNIETVARVMLIMKFTGLIEEQLSIERQGNIEMMMTTTTGRTDEQQKNRNTRTIRKRRLDAGQQDDAFFTKSRISMILSSWRDAGLQGRQLDDGQQWTLLALMTE